MRLKRLFSKNRKHKALRRPYTGLARLRLELLLIAFFICTGLYFTLRSAAAGTATVTVTSTQAGTIQTQLSTNNVWAGLVDNAPGGQAKLNALHAPLIRLHVGDDGGAPAEPMPEIQHNQWSFANLDVLVNDVFNAGQQPLMNIKFAPDWQWTCLTPQTGQAGTVADQTFQAYAQYMARIVSYYNKGTMTTETGTVITNPVGTSHKITYWEPWNEPDLNNETPCAPATGVALTPAQYLTMWNAVTAAMLQVDPTVKFVGPASAGGQFGSSTSTGNQYVDDLMASAVTKPAAISFHSYGYWDNTVTDKWIFDGDNSDPANNCCGGFPDMVNGTNAIHALYPTVPIWLTEVNVNADWGADTYKRPWSEYAAAWWGTAFQQMAPLNVGIIHQYDIADGAQFGLFDDVTGGARMAYYVFQLLDQEFPQGSTILSSSSDTNGILSLAVRRPDGHVSVMIVNRQLASSSVHSGCGAGGVAATVSVNLSGFTPTSATLQQLDKNNVNCSTGYATAPTTQAINVAQPISVTLPGYGLAVFDLTLPAAAPVISNISASPITSSGATITWATDIAADSQVDYGLTSSYGNSTTLNATLVTSHQVALSGLTASTLYHYRIRTRDGSGNLATSGDNTFTTTPSSVPNLSDINGDGKVDIFDLSFLLSSYGQSSPSCSTHVAYSCDLNSDNKVDVFDMSILLSHYGT